MRNYGADDQSAILEKVRLVFYFKTNFCFVFTKYTKCVLPGSIG